MYKEEIFKQQHYNCLVLKIIVKAIGAEIINQKKNPPNMLRNKRLDGQDHDKEAENLHPRDKSSQFNKKQLLFSLTHAKIT